MMDVGTKVCDIVLGGTERVKNFCNLLIPFESDLSLLSGRFVIDAKSIMGVFSLDSSKKITLAILEKADGELEKLRILMKDNGYAVE